MCFNSDKIISLLLAGSLIVLPGCAGSNGSTMGRSAASLAQESRAQQYTIGPQFENQLSEMISQEAVALGVKEGVPMELNREVLLNINYFLNDARNFMITGLSRGSKYIPMMKAIFRQKGLPEDLVYLALIESGFKTSAVSSASAVGPWQFIASTGRNYGLTINDFVDERRDPVKSTYAAADYLTTLHDMFNSWPLAIAAYNSGEGKILKGMKNYGVSNFWDMSDVRDHLATETKLYVPSFLAATFIAKDPAAYGLTIDIQEPDQWDEIVVPAPISLKKVADFTGSDLNSIKELNPHLRKDTTPPDETNFVLRIPQGSGKRFAKAYGGYAKDSEAVAQTIAMAKSSLGKPTLSTITHKVKSGDTLGSIAKRYGVTTGLIQKNNNLKGTGIKVGQVLKIQSDLPLTAQKKSEPGKLMVVATEARPRSMGSHTVSSGETLTSIARKYNMSIKELADVNKLQGTAIKVGQKLSVAGAPQKSGGQSGTSAAPKAGGTHTVAAGETVGHIAQKYGLTSRELMALNGISSPNIRVGQKLKVPARRGAAQPAAAKAALQSAVKPVVGTHTVAAGETMGHIAQKYGLTSRELMALNDISSPNIRVGQKLKVPAGSGAAQPAAAKAAPQSAVKPVAGTHTVAAGETVGHIAQKYGLTSKELMALNGMSNPSIGIGQKLKVKADGGGNKPAAPKASENKAQPQPKSKPPASSGAASQPPASASGKTHTVVSGDNIGSIAQKYGLSPKELMALNNLNDPIIRVGQKLKISR